MIEVRVPGMQCRHDVRDISARVADLAGVVALEVDIATRTVRVAGDVSVEAVRAAIAAAGDGLMEWRD
jgi:copper chaperone CopZ